MLVKPSPEPRAAPMREAQSAIDRLTAVAPEMLEVLFQCEAYFDNKADADHDETGFVPNQEMILQAAIQAVIAKVGPDDLPF